MAEQASASELMHVAFGVADLLVERNDEKNAPSDIQLLLAERERRRIPPTCICGSTIPENRIKAKPFTQLCKDCAEKKENKN
jgi:hypothetical protein